MQNRSSKEILDDNSTNVDGFLWDCAEISNRKVTGNLQGKKLAKRSVGIALDY